MRDRWRERRSWLIVAICSYELVALGTHRVPTITRLCHRAREHPLGAGVILAALGWLTHHLLLEGEDG